MLYNYTYQECEMYKLLNCGLLLCIMVVEQFDMGELVGLDNRFLDWCSVCTKTQTLTDDVREGVQLECK